MSELLRFMRAFSRITDVFSLYSYRVENPPVRGMSWR